jgi:hypothetical protein
MRRRFAASLFALVGAGAAASGQTSDTSGEFWPEVDLHAQLHSKVRLLTFGGLKKGEEFPYQQWNVGTGIGYQWWRFARDHEPNLDPDKENYLVTGVGYEYLRTIQSGKDSSEDRIALEAIPRFRPGAGILLEDRNRFEFRWVDGAYSTRYRNRFNVERELCLEGFRFTPYVSAEFFYEVQKSEWQKEQYAGGFRLPYRRILMVEVYYLRQNCTSCSPAHLNVAGLTVNLYFDAR